MLLNEKADTNKVNHIENTKLHPIDVRNQKKYNKERFQAVQHKAHLKMSDEDGDEDG